MGLHIIVRKVGECVTTDYGDVDYDTSDLEWWDVLRYVGDKEFVSNNEFTYGSEDYCRPSDISKCRTWIVENIPDARQPRLLNLMDRIDDDPTIFLKFSY